MIKHIINLGLMLLSVRICTAQQNNNTDTVNKLHQKARIIILKDTDHDGVADQFDMEPNTPAGCPVDTHGVMLDTDGDGIPDCRDKEKLSRADCFPPDSNGIVSCPELNCCGTVDYFGCDMPDFPSFQFKQGTKGLQKQETLLDSLAIAMMNYPVCKITIQSYYTINNKTSLELTTARIQKIINYITDKWSVSPERFTINMKPGVYINPVNFIHD